MAISTHTPLAGRDRRRRLRPSWGRVFQLTRPLRGATGAGACAPRGGAYFNSHAPCGARLSSPLILFNYSKISTHTPLAGRDVPLTASHPRKGGFQLTRPLRGATQRLFSALNVWNISTHTPLAGRDRVLWLFLMRFAIISTHTPLAGRDGSGLDFSAENYNFNSHAPCGARLSQIPVIPSVSHFNSHAPCGARRTQRWTRCQRLLISTHTPLAGRDVVQYAEQLMRGHFNSHAPCGARQTPFT